MDSHGIMRTAAYFERYRKKAINVKPDIKVVAGEKAFVVMDADNASGFVASRYAMEHAIVLAREYHIAAVCVKNSNHFGAAALYAQMAVDAGMVGMASTNVRPNITAPREQKGALLVITLSPLGSPLMTITRLCWIWHFLLLRVGN